MSILLLFFSTPLGLNIPDDNYTEREMMTVLQAHSPFDPYSALHICDFVSALIIMCSSSHHLSLNVLVRIDECYLSVLPSCLLNNIIEYYPPRITDP